MSAPSDGARADARKARLGKVDAPRDVEAVAWMIHRACGCSDADIGFNGPIQLDGPCPPDREDYEGARDIVASDWLAGVIADAKAEALREAAAYLRRHGAALFDKRGPNDARGAGLWDGGCAIDPDDGDAFGHRARR